MVLSNPYRTLDIRTVKDREYLIGIIQKNSNWANIRIDDIKDGLEFFINNLQNTDWLIMYPSIPEEIGHFVIGDRHKIHVSLREIILAGYKLKSLSVCKGFEHLLSGFFSEKQFKDTLFEIDVAYYCFTRPKTKSLIFFPEYNVRNHIKHPEFLIISEAGELVCECKNLHPSEHNYFKRFNNLFKIINSHIESLTIPNDIRVDIHFNAAPKGDLNKLGALIKSKTEEMIKHNVSKVDEFDSVQLYVGKRREKPRFESFHLATQSITVGNTPTSLSSENAYLRISSDRFDSYLIKMVGNAIKDAKSQLPEIMDCAIFLNLSRLEFAEKAVDLRIGTDEYKHILVYGLWTNQLNFRFRKKDRQKVTDYLGPF